jgi:hypothetical protein
MEQVVFAARDKKYSVDGSQGGFHVAQLNTKIALSVASNCNRPGKGTRYITHTGWTELAKCDDGIDGWQTKSYPSLFSSKHFDEHAGRFTAPVRGMFFTSAMVRLDQVFLPFHSDDRSVLALSVTPGGNHCKLRWVRRHPKESLGWRS